jgi:hypothetical protein
MQGLDPAVVSQLPTGMQILIYGAFALGVMLAVFKTPAEADPRQTAKDLVMTSGVIADMGPVREAAQSLEKIEGLIERAIEENKQFHHDLLAEKRAKRAVWERISQRLETNAEIARYAEHRSHRQEDRG